ncbi:chymotrypsin family serine protease [Zavarzinella formosa]|uniref:hypothetical protein n=1 Tax=Zavarzinella formosa TaxID=360055 RepID=UPI0012FAE35E|nr:hypothetical protein [Zavarzinella formosa]
MVRPQGISLFSAAVNPDPKINVVGVGIGEMLEGSKPTGVMAVKFFVQRKIDASLLKKKQLLPKTVSGMPTDVEEVGLLVPQAAGRLPDPRTKHRPIAPGSSVGFVFPDQPDLHMAGTFGAAVTDSNGKVCILSNNHVLANERTDQEGSGLPIGAPIYQPGLLDGGQVPQDHVADLSGVVPYKLEGNNEVDAAVAKIRNGIGWTKDILKIGAPTGTAAAVHDMLVHKYGRTTRYTVGRVTSINTDVNLPFNIGTVFFADQIVIRGLDGLRFSDTGDSGSLILERSTNKAVGLLFAGSATHTIANHIDKALTALGVQLA